MVDVGRTHEKPYFNIRHAICELKRCEAVLKISTKGTEQSYRLLVEFQKLRGVFNLKRMLRKRVKNSFDPAGSTLKHGRIWLTGEMQ